jgi:hypothetical protein
MYLYYCKDANCHGHTKSWERCCDIRAFATKAMTGKGMGMKTVPAAGAALHSAGRASVNTARRPSEG